MGRAGAFFAGSAVALCGCVAVAPRNPRQPPAREPGTTRLRYFGHYWVDSTTYGAHLDQVIDTCNVHWVEGVAGLKKCAARDAKCIVQLRWEFLASGPTRDGKRSSVLRADHLDQWRRTAREIAPLIDHVEAFYMIDEPYWNGVAPDDLASAIRIVKGRFPGKPVMVVFAPPSLTPDLLVPEQADWIGFDHYATIDRVRADLQLLKTRMHRQQDIFLVPQSFVNKTAPADADLAVRNWEYYFLAASDPRVIGLLSFGLFTEKRSIPIPETLRVQSTIAELIRANNARPEGSVGTE